MPKAFAVPVEPGDIFACVFASALMQTLSRRQRREVFAEMDRLFEELRQSDSTVVLKVLGSAETADDAMLLARSGAFAVYREWRSRVLDRE
jgi:hypothetical protein